MSPQDIVSELTKELNTTFEHFKTDLAKTRTGRAHPSMVENLMVQVYGTAMPLLQLATITAPESQLIQISPFDPTNISAISTAIRNDQSLGLNPMDDGRLVRVVLPSLTTERRQQLVKTISTKKEETHIASRNIRQEYIKAIESAKKNKEISEDDAKRYEKSIETEMSNFKERVEKAVKEKEAEIMTI